MTHHGLNEYFPKLREFSSTAELERSQAYAEIRDRVQKTLGGLLQENLAPADAPSSNPVLHATAWNIERGIHFERIVEILRCHPKIAGSDFLFLTELDHGMARSGNRLVAPELARALSLNYVFAPCYLNLAKGSGVESEVSGENTASLHGNALFSRFPLEQAHSLSLPNGKDKMQGKEKRLGSQAAVFALVRHSLGDFWAVCVHLDAHSTQKHRRLQMKMILDHVETLRPAGPVLIGGDWNTSTYNSKRATYSILGYCRRVMMGVKHVIKNHYPHPDRWFERGLFRELERRGYNYKNLNQLGACTLHYDVRNFALNKNMGDWIPGWCFWFIRWALMRNTGNEGKCSLKLDWFAGRGIQPDPSRPPEVIHDVLHSESISDHDPIVLHFVPRLRRAVSLCVIPR